jgi:hypothetical protein
MEMNRDEIVNFGEASSLTGIFASAKNSELNGKPCAIFLNAGLIHKVGPNRLYKKLSENYSENGLSTFRFDFSGSGDSEHSSKKLASDAHYFTEITMAMNWIEENKGIDKFLLSGICSGATLAFSASIDDSRVVGLSLIDGFYGDNDLLNEIGNQAERNTARRYYKKHIFSLKRWIKLISGRSNFLNANKIAVWIKLIGQLARKFINVKNITIGIKKKWSPTLLQKGAEDKNDSYQVVLANQSLLNPWDTLIDRGVKIQMIFCEGGTAIDLYNMTLAKQLKKNIKAGELQSILIKDVDHTFTPIWSQNHLSDLTTSWLRKEFG